MKKRSITALLLIIAMLIAAIPVFAEGTAALSGTIYLPEGITAKDGDYIEIGLRQMERGSDGRITYYRDGSLHKTYDLENGQTSVTYSVNAPEGSYALEVIASVDGVYTWWHSYSSDGLTDDELLAEPVDLTADKTVNVTLPAFERTVSGIITLDKPAGEDGYISLSLSGVDDLYSNDFYAEIPVSKGQQSVEYSVNVLKGAYTLSVENNSPFPVGYHYSVRGDFLYPTDEQCYIDTREKSASLDFELPSDRFVSYGNSAVSGRATGTESDEEDLTPVTVKMPAGIAADKKIGLFFTDNSGKNTYTDYSATVPVPAGDTAVTESIELPENDFYIAIEADWNNGFEEVYYVGGEYGITSDASKATLFSAGQPSLTLDLTNAFSVVSGTVSRGGVKEGEPLEFGMSVYVKNEQDDPQEDIYLGPGFGSSGIYMKQNENSVPYAILIPHELSGEAELFMEYSFNDTISAKRKSITLSGNTTQDLSFPNLFHKITGTVSLSSPAPKGGAAVRIYQTENSTVDYYIAQGESEVNYEYYALNDSDELNFECISDDARYNQYESIPIDNETVGTDAEITVNAKTIGGTVSVKDGAAMPNAVSYLITVVAYGEDGDAIDSFEQHGTIFKDGTDGEYSINLPDTTATTEAMLKILAEGDMELTVIPDNTDFTLTSEVGLTNITAEYDSENEQIAISYTSDGEADYTVQAIAAVYDENGALIYAQPEQLIFDREAPRTTFSAELNDKLNANTTVSLLLWKSFKSMTPVCGKIPVTTE